MFVCLFHIYSSNKRDFVNKIGLRNKSFFLMKVIEDEIDDFEKKIFDK